MKVDFNTTILNTIIETDPEKSVAIIAKFPKIEMWLQEKEKPTFNQLVNVAKLFNIPFGYFFLEKIPDKKYPIPHFRTSGQKPFQPSQELSDTLDTLRERQDWARDILHELREEKQPYANSLTPTNSIESAVKSINSMLQLSNHWANEVANWTDALRLLIEKTERSGIFVVVNGVVNNNTKRKLDVKEFRGFVLYDDFAPFVFLNNNDAISGKIFTLIHEIAHILVGKSASFDLRQLQPAPDDTEKFCDKVAAEFLVPSDQLTKYVQNSGINYQEMAKTFKVSQIVIARRLKDLEQISTKEFFDFYDEYIGKELKTKSKKGGNFYNTAPYRISKEFFNLINNSVKQNKMLYMDAFRLTGLKPKTYDEYVRKNLT